MHREGRDNAATRVIELAWGVPWLLTGVSIIALLATLAASHRKLQAEEMRSSATLSHLRGELRTAESRIRELETRENQLTNDNRSLQAHIDAVSQDLRFVEASLARAESLARALEKLLSDPIKRGNARVTTYRAYVRLSLRDELLFSREEPTLANRGAVLLRGVAGLLRPGEVVNVFAHSDGSPPRHPLDNLYPSLWDLTAAKAATVARFLSQDMGLPPQRLLAGTYGSGWPLSTSATNKAQNRRLDLLIGPPIDPTLERPDTSSSLPPQASQDPSKRRRR